MPSKTSDIFHEWKYPAVIGLMLFGLVFSKWILSVSQFFLLFAVLSDKSSRSRLIAAFKSPVVLAIISIYLLHLIGLLWTSDMKYGIKDIQNKLPMLAIPVLFFAAGPMKKNWAIYLLLFFTANVLLLSILSLINYYVSPDVPERIAIGQSHIRFSLLICLALIILIHFSDVKFKWLKYALVPAILLLLYFLFILESFTGYVVLISLLFLIPVLYWNYLRKKRLRLILVGLLTITAILGVAGFVDVKTRCFPEPLIKDFSDLPVQTSNGNYYTHDTINLLTENGHYMYLNLCVPEMVSAWNNRCESKIPESGPQSVAKTNILTRYLTSKGLPKDSAGVMQLSETDIRNIENGYSNHLLPGFDPYRERIYRFLWEQSYYKLTGDPSGHSLTQRFEFWKTAVRIFRKNPLFGTGTGDINQAFKDEYIIAHSKLKPEYRLRSHNQYLSFAVALGLTGLLVFLCSLTAPFFLHIIPDRKLYFGFIFIFLLSLLNEDTLETQVGVTFYALFNSFILFLIPHKNKSEDEKERA